MTPVSSPRKARRTAARHAAACAVRPAVTRAESLEPRVLLAVFTVTTAADDGPGSLRQAIVSANALAGPDEVRFNIPGAGVQTIAPLSPLPPVTGALNLDATTQPGYLDTPVIELNGLQVPRPPAVLPRGLVVQAGPSLVRGLAVNRFGGDGIVLADGATGSRVEACFIGTNPAGTQAAGNGGAGVRVEAGGVTIGGGGAERRNVISGNVIGILFDGQSAGTAAGVVSGNYVGTDAAGASALGNRTYGIELASVTTVRVGGPDAAARNLVSGNGASGIFVAPSTIPPTQGPIQGNYVGTDVLGMRAVPNGTGPNATYPNVTYHDGITLRNRVTAVTGNLVSGNRGNGMTGLAGLVAGNYIGTNATGQGALGNEGNGIEGVVAGNQSVGAPGPASVPPVIDPAGTGRNVISGNGGYGILATGGDGRIAYNYIGLSADGALPLGNRHSGIHAAGHYLVIGGTGAGQGNVISANGGDGVTSVDGATILGNRIGTNAAGDAATPGLGNAGNGVLLLGAATTLGGYNIVHTRTVSNNTIAFNGANGVMVQGSDAASPIGTISRNSIFSNARLGIDLALPSPGVSDVHPVILAAVSDGEATAVRFRGLGTVEFFASPEPDPSGFGEGKTFLAAPFSDGTEQTVRLPRVAPGMFITATSTVGKRIDWGVRPDTSEFSNAVAVVPGVVEPSASVADRYVFYNWSAFDSSQPGFAEYPPNDDPAIDPTKRALLPGQTGSFANVTSFTKGLNGIMFDMKDMPLGTQPPNIEVKMSVPGAGPGDPVAWVPAPRPTLIDRRHGAGVGQSDRITLIWPNNSIRNRWLQVTVKADAVSWLPRDDVFYFGNLVGETGDAASPLRVSAVDLAATRRATQVFPGPVGVREKYDIDRNGTLAGTTDVAAVRENLGRGLPALVAPPAPASTLSTSLLRRKSARDELTT
jgi:hypothetical protein